MIFRNLLCCQAASLALILTFAPCALGQRDGGGIPGGFPVPTPAQPATGGNPTGQTNSPQQSTNTGGDTQVDFGSLLDFDITPVPVEIESMRLQPFVGPSRSAFVEQGIAHPRSMIEPTGGASTTGGGGGFGGFTFNPRGGAGSAGGTASAGNGFEVARMGLRTRLVRSFSVVRPPNTVAVSTRFAQRLGRIPVVQSSSREVNVSVEGRTAILTGSASSPAERDRIERMARLEPGIYQIENRIVVREP